MRIAFDLDGTLWSYMHTFKCMKNLLQKSGHEIGVLTVHWEDIKQKDLELLESRGFYNWDFFVCRRKEDVLTEEDTASWKLRMLAKYNIDLLFDDCENGEEDMYLELFNSGKLIFIEPRQPISTHYR